MTIFKCEKCEYQTKIKRLMNNHLNKKNPCKTEIVLMSKNPSKESEESEEKKNELKKKEQTLNERENDLIQKEKTLEKCIKKLADERKTLPHKPVSSQTKQTPHIIFA